MAAEGEADRTLHEVGALVEEFDYPVAGIVDDIGVAAIAAKHLVGAGQADQRIVAAEAVDLVVEQVMAIERLAILRPADQAVARIEDLLADRTGLGIVRDGAAVGPGDDKASVGERAHRRENLTVQRWPY